VEVATTFSEEVAVLEATVEDSAIGIAKVALELAVAVDDATLDATGLATVDVATASTRVEAVELAADTDEASTTLFADDADTGHITAGV